MTLKNYFMALSNSVENVFKRVQGLGSGLFRLSLLANIKDTSSGEKISIILSPEKNEVNDGFNNLFQYKIEAPMDVWNKVFHGEETLIGNLIAGNVLAPDMRAMWMPILVLSMLISLLLSMKILKIN